INPTLYRLARTSDVFHDVTTGDNAVPCVQGSPGCVDGFVGFKAGPGYDLATGLGSIDAARLVAQWSVGSTSTTTVSAGAVPAGSTGTVKLTATVQGTASSSPTGVVTFVAQTGLDLVLGSALLTSSGAGASATIDVPVRAL